MDFITGLHAGCSRSEGQIRAGGMQVVAMVTLLVNPAALRAPGSSGSEKLILV